ncbi:hypothetical protein D1632_00270 [Chryseobacterium nematophagum]|uniref:Lipoprotein n=1 Tax=Chryseobacterium nematophagum TaxID=2305228 RepID=A0A3M7LF05_9FLAO|nr:hypothetical protein [Chryseobacterium nematophagum]RMZ61281.1 hypothetical protein D1632_00270 [Chryseobacterium nematophagum]
MKKIFIPLTIIALFFSCSKENKAEQTQAQNVKTEKDIEDSIRKKQEQEVINMDANIDDSQKSLNEDLKKMK